MKRSPLYLFGKWIAQWLLIPFLPYRSKNKDRVPKEGAGVLCCNHLGMSDSLRLAFTQKRQIYYMAKAELFEFKPLGMILHGVGAFPVQRGKGDLGAINFAAKHLKEGHMLGIFPEGHRSETGEPGQPKAGAVMLAYKYNVPIIPCAITMKGGGPMKLFHMATVAFGEPIMPSELGIVRGSGTEFRNATRLVFEKIMEMRERDR